MKARTLLMTLIAVAIVAAPVVMVAQSAPGGGPGGQGGFGPRGGHMGTYGGDHGLGFFNHMLPRLAERIGLSDDQVEQIEAIVDENRPAIEGYAEQLRVGREEYRSQNNDPTVFDEGAYRSHANAQHAIQIELKVVVEQTKIQVFQVLTQEQRDALAEMRSEMGQRMKRRSGGRRAQ